MAVTYGFFNSTGGDRKYSAVQFGDIFDTFINDGVFRDLDNMLDVIPGTGSQVVVRSGWAWFDGTWTRNDADLAVALPTASTSPRYDAVVLQVNKADGIRANSIMVVSGTPASTPVKPTLTKAGTTFQYALAYVLRPANSTSVTTGDIEKRVGTIDCPWATNRLASPRESPTITSGTGAPSGGADGDLYFKVV